MQANSRLVLLAILASGFAQAQPIQVPVGHAIPPNSNENLMPIAVPPAPMQLAPLSPDFQAAMANSQLATYRYTQLTEQALALKKLCDTGFGPADICPRAAAASGPATAAQAELPTVTEITGTRSGLSAVLALPDGTHIEVRAGSILPDGRRIAAVSDDDVRLVRESGSDIVLSFAGGELK